MKRRRGSEDDERGGRRRAAVDAARGAREAGRRAGQRARRMRHAISQRMRIRRIPSIISPADLFTLTNGFMGLLSVLVLTGSAKLYEPPFLPGVTNALAVDERFLTVAIFITVGLMADALDGIVARKFGGSRLGADLDTICDTVTFVVAPCVLILTAYGPDSPFRSLTAAGLVFMMGVVRLARFNSNPYEADTKQFQGLPTPWCAIAIVLTVLMGIPGRFAIPAFMVLAFLMMSNAAYPKSRDRVRYIAYLAIAVAAVLVSSLILFPSEQPRIVRGSFVLVVLTIALTPFLLARRKRALERKAAANAPGEGGGGGGRTGAGEP